MKPRARIVLALCFAVLSTGTIVTCATTGRGPPSEPVEKLKRFDINFNRTINEAIRSPNASSFASQTCFTSFVTDHIQNVADAGTAVCNLSRSDKQELRSAVNKWLDDVYARTGPLDADPIPYGTIDSTWFSMKVENTVVIGPDTGDGGAADGGAPSDGGDR